MATQLLETPLSYTTYRLLYAQLGLRDKQVAYDLREHNNGEPFDLRTVRQWRERPQGRDTPRKPFPFVTEYINNWLELTTKDFDDYTVKLIEEYRVKGEPITIYTGRSTEGMEALGPRWAAYRSHASVHQSLMGRVLLELHAEGIPTRIEYIEAAINRTKRGDPEPAFRTDRSGE